MPSETLDAERVELEVEVADMHMGDLLQVLDIERRCYRSPWSLSAFLGEFLSRRSERLVVRGTGTRRVLGFLIAWVAHPELHVSNLAVHPGWRRRGLAERLLREIFRRGQELGSREVHLEVRPSNRAANELYRRLGFARIGTRKRYYSDSGEDAWMMRLDLPGVDGLGPLARSAGGREGGRP